MKFLALLFISLILDRAQAEIDDYVANMAAMSIPTSLRMIELEENPKTQKSIAKRLSRYLFSYWYEVEVLKKSRSSKIDRMVRLVYCVSEDDDLRSKNPICDLLRSVLRDPLDALGKEKNLKTEESWKFSTKKEYQELIKKFTDFLKD